MKIAYENRTPFQFPLCGGGTLVIHPGKIVGEFLLRRFVDPRYDESMGYLSVHFEFKDLAGNCYSYECLIPPWNLWPPKTLPVRSNPQCQFESLLRIKAVLDSSEPYSLLVNGSDEIKGTFKYTDVEYDINMVSTGVAIRNHFHCGDQSVAKDPMTPGYCTVYYELPFSHFLWRNATKFYSDDLIAEGENCVDAKKVPSSLDLSGSAIEVNT